MKKICLLALTALGLFACSKEEVPSPTDSQESVAVISINVESGVMSRAIEGGHSGADGVEVAPKISNVVVIPYNDRGVALAGIQLTADQLKAAVYGNGKFTDGTAIPGTSAKGAMVGLPVGTKKVDVVVNQSADGMGITNINCFNYRDNKDGSGKDYGFGSDNFDRVQLVTDQNGVGQDLGSNSATGSEIPTYKLSFTVKPSLARFEIFGAIQTKEAEFWVDKYGDTWCTMDKTAFDQLLITKNITLTPNEKGEYGDYGVVAGTGTGTGGNGFDATKVYIPKYYPLAATGYVFDKVTIVTDGASKNVYTRDIILANNGTNAGWAIQETDFWKNDTQVTWFPNEYYAVDVEEIFINNIKIRGANYAANMHNWPGNQSTTYWPNWYNAFHLDGWHTAGVSADNTFLCRGNMWDRIAGPASGDGTADVDVPPVGSGSSKMPVIIRKATELAGKSVHYNTTLHKDLGVLQGKAASFQIYAQKATSAVDDVENLKSELPHVILKVKAYKTEADYKNGETQNNTYVAGKQFITVKLFKNGADRITDFVSGKIYRLDMNSLLSSFVGSIPVPGGESSVTPADPIDPDPEMPGSQVEVSIKVVPWTIVNMTPEI